MHPGEDVQAIPNVQRKSAMAMLFKFTKIEHTAFSRNVFAQGAVYAAEWLSRQTEPRIFDMADVLDLK